MARVPLYILLAGAMICSMACSLLNHRSAHNRPMLHDYCYMLQVQPPKAQLARKDLEDIARKYQIKRGERPNIDLLLELNKDCRQTSQEALDLGSPPGQLDAGQAPCRGGWLLVPIAENTTPGVRSN